MYKRQKCYLIYNTIYNCVKETDSGHPNKTQQEEISVSVKLEVCWLWIQYGADKLSFGGAESWGHNTHHINELL